MTPDLELTILREPTEGTGYVGSFAITDRSVVAAGGTTRCSPTLLVRSDGRGFEARRTPRELGLRAVLAAGEWLWICGEYGQLAVSSDHGDSWRLIETGTERCLFGLARASDGSVWVVGDAGYMARVRSDREPDVRLERIELGTTTRLGAAYTLDDEIVVVCGDGAVRRWRDGEVRTVTTGATRGLNGMARMPSGTWIVVGDGGFIARSPDGVWFAHVRSGVDVDLESVTALADGRVVAVGDRGAVLVSCDGGHTWERTTTAMTAHLWSIERCGGGAVIGGDDGLIMKLAPRGDSMWSERAIRPLDGEAAAFERTWGVALPPELRRLRELADDHDDLGLAIQLLPEDGNDNLFELLVLRDQHADRGTGLVEAFSGVFGLGARGAAGAYHMEVYEWDGPRQVLHYDLTTRAFTVCADTLDSHMAFVALVRARQRGEVSVAAAEVALRTLNGKVAPAGSLACDELAHELIRLDPRRRDTEFLCSRSRWICALLANDAADLAQLRQLFDAELNQVVPAAQLPARLEACEQLIPTALYAMWRALLFDEPELASYLEIGRRHRARLVRDAARLIDELRAGRNTLGAIGDVATRLAGFRALGLDPRGASARHRDVRARDPGSIVADPEIS
jgi:hypothetical protein